MSSKHAYSPLQFYTLSTVIYKPLVSSFNSYLQVPFSTLCFNSLYVFWGVCFRFHMFKTAHYIHCTLFSNKIFTLTSGTCMIKATLYGLITLNALLFQQTILLTLIRNVIFKYFEKSCGQPLSLVFSRFNILYFHLDL